MDHRFVYDDMSYERLSDVIYGIMELVYEISWFDSSILHVRWRRVYTICQNGFLKYQYFKNKEDTPDEERTVEIDWNDAINLYNRIFTCIRTIKRYETFTNDTGTRIMVNYLHGRIELPGYLTDGECYLYEIVEDFITNHGFELQA